MPLPTVSFVLGLGVLFYLSTFVLLALLRIITGVSIQRVSYSGLRRIAFSPRDGISIRIRGIGISLHRPTFAQPTWISLTLTEPRIIVDLAALRAAQENTAGTHVKSNGSANGKPKGSANTKERDGKKDRAHLFERLTEWKERIKRLHRQIDWLRHIDLVMLRSSIIIKDVGSLRMERFTLSVDTRPKTVDRSRLFQHSKTRNDTARPAEWMSIVRSILLTVDGKESTEVLDYCTVSVHGFLHKKLDGLRDASIAVKMGRATIPYDDFESLAERLEALRGPSPYQDEEFDVPTTPCIEMDSFTFDETDTEADARAVEAIKDSKEFAGSILRGIQEIQLAVGFFGLSKRIKSLHTSGQHVYFNLAMKEVGLDLMRLDPKSPAHRMYFSPKDVAHQALLTAISIAAGLDDGHEHPERMVYIPMVTATIKTTLPSKILQATSASHSDSDLGEKNTNIFLANLVCTSPSVDVDPKHFPLVLAIIKSKQAASPKGVSHKSRRRGYSFVSKLLPKATIKIAVQEPVIRVSLPKRGEEGDYDMIISSVSSMAMDIESQHEASSDSHYSLSINYRHTIHRLYGQTFDGIRHELLFADTVEVKLDINAFPEMTVMVAGRFQNFSLFLIQPEICEGLRQIVLSLRKEIAGADRSKSSEKQSFLRRAPAWLQHVHLEGSDFNVEVTSVEPSVSKYARGVGLHLESWSVEHKANREEIFTSVSRRRSTSRASYREQSPRQGQSSSPRRKNISPTDGRRLAVHIEGLEGLIIDPISNTQGDPFLALPLFEVAFSTSTDQHGPIFHINAKAEKLYVNYSLYNHFAIGVAYVLLKKTLIPSVAETVPSQKYNLRENHHRASLALPHSSDSDSGPVQTVAEITTIDVRAGLIQVKASMPADPPLMLQVYGLEGGRHRWATPFMRSKLARMYAGTPGMQSIWSRIVSLKTLRVDLRTTRKKIGRNTVEEKSIDIATEAIRIGVPHQLVVHSIFDNITNVVKVNEQLHHQFITGSSDYVLDKTPEGPKHVPKISLRTQVMIFEIEDSPFEYKLGVIYRTGLLEQRQRLARDQAYELKAKRMNPRGQRRGSQARARSARPLQRDKTSPDLDQRPRSSSARPSTRTHHQSRLRYDTEGKCDMGGSVNRSSEQAKDVLNRFNAQSWKERIDRAWSTQRHAIKDIRNFFFGIDELPEEVEEVEPIMGMSLRPGLASLCVSDLSITLDKPSFPLKDLPQFMRDVGKGIPLDQQYSLLIPVHVHISMGEARAYLRDYPLPLIHIPAIRSGQSPRLPSLALTTNFVIAEEYRNNESRRDVKVMVVSPDKLGPDDDRDGYSVVVRRTISPVKTYSNMKVDINTSAPTRITWGTSYQPAIQDMMQVIEGFTKPPIDPSDRVGFWDKIRLSFHSRIMVSWKGDGDVHLNLKGSRDPYIVTGDGAGFVMVWRNNVCWRIAQDGDPRKFMTVDSGDYILAIPDYDHYARHVLDTEEVTDNSASSADSMKSTAMFKKVVMKLSGNVQWLLGLMFEQSTDDGKRHFDFRNHYDVVLKHPKYAKAIDGKPYDAYHGFRSQHIHMSIAVAAPQSRDWNVLNVKPSDNYNSVHLTPRFFTHFLKWWSLFSGVMSLPVRQGPLWGSQEKSSKKFGRHLATIKYNLLLSPVFIAHMYKHKDAEDFSAESVAVTGLKMKIDSFMLDLHQRREYFEIPGNKDGEPKRTSGMRINKGQLDFISGDFRAVSANIRGTSKEDVENGDEDGISSFQAEPPAVDMSRFTIPDNDFTWIDMDDFVELDWILPQESNPETKILPLGSAPRFTYFRQTDHGDSVSGDTTRSSPFGDEPTHYCVMSKRNDPRQVQADLIQQRLDKIMEQISNSERSAGDAELKIIRDATNDQKYHDDLANLKKHSETLRNKHAFLHGMLKTLRQRLETDDSSAVPGLETQEPALNRQESEWRNAHMTEGLSSVPLADESGEFNNRFVVHNAQIKWNNSLRNIILRYIHQVGQRRGFVYYMSRRAVKFILDIIEEKKRSNHPHMDASSRKSSQATEPLSPQQDDDMTVEDRIAQILSDGKAFVDADDSDRPKPTPRTTYDANNDEISTEFVAQNTYHFRLIAPQIQLQSEKNPKSVILIAAKGMHLKVIQIMDKDRVMDEISGLVQRRFNAAMDSMQVFVASTKTFSTDYLHMYSGDRYGTKAGSFWPPWVPMEVMYEFSVNPYGFSRVVQRTSASLRYDKYNNLRLKYNDDISKGQGETDGPEHRMDHLTVEFPQFRAICDSAQYYALYIIAMDLLLYNEPLEKTRSERLEKIMLASDFSDLTGAPEMVEMLQSRIRQLEEIKMHFQIHEKLLDRQGWKDRIAMDHDLTSCEDELFFMMKAITTSQQRTEDRGAQDTSSGILHWLVIAKELAWHLVREQDQKFLEFQIRDTTFERTDNNDGSNSNVVEFGRINGYNFLPNAIYRDLIAPYVDEKGGYPELKEENKMLRVQWLMLEAIAGIPVVDYFEVDLVPVRVQLEREVAKRLFEYVFPGVGGSAFEGSGFSPFMVKKMLPSTEDSDEGLSAQDSGASPPPANIPEEKHHQGTGTGAGTLESRLQPTLRLSDSKTTPKTKQRGLGIPDSHGNLSAHWSLFQHKNRSSSSVQRNKTPTSKPTPSNLSITSRTPSQASIADDILSPASQSDKRKTPAPSIRKSAELTRSGSKSKKDLTPSTNGKDNSNPNSQSDDLTLMLSRASNYITLSYFHIHSLILCLSYKGQGKRNIEDVHDLVFRLPIIEYRNKTWSNLDLAMELKREVLKALVGHAGRIVGNKFRRAPGRVQGRVEGMRESLLLSGGTKANRVSEDASSAFAETEESEAWGRASGTTLYSGKSQSEEGSMLGRSMTRDDESAEGTGTGTGTGTASGPSSRSRASTEARPNGVQRSATGQDVSEGQVSRGEQEGPSISLNGTPLRQNSAGVESNGGDNRSLKSSIRLFSGLSSGLSSGRSRSGTQNSSGSFSRSSPGPNGSSNSSGKGDGKGEEEKEEEQKEDGGRDGGKDGGGKDEGGDKRKSRLLLGGRKVFGKFAGP